jgi:hypothetical protein
MTNKIEIETLGSCGHRTTTSATSPRWQPASARVANAPSPDSTKITKWENSYVSYVQSSVLEILFSLTDAF